MIDIVKGLGYALENGLTHRDLKLNNVLVTKTWQAKVVDFGLATIQEEAAAEAGNDVQNVRTVEYAALEQATGVRKDDKRSDIYFAGAIFYHMLTGESPLLETRDRSKRMNKQRFLESYSDPRPRSGTFALGMYGGQQGDDDGAFAALPVARGNAGRSGDRRAAIDRGRRPAAAEADLAALGTYAEVKQPTVLVVESDPKWQDIFRGGFKRVNYQVLVTADPHRAVARPPGEIGDPVPHFCAQGLGKAALTGFNELAADDRTSSLPALLLLDEPQKDWKTQAALAEHRVVLTMPITMKEPPQHVGGASRASRSVNKAATDRRRLL